MSVHPAIEACRRVDGQDEAKENERHAAAMNAVRIALSHRQAAAFTDMDAWAVRVIERILSVVANEDVRRATPAGFAPGDTRTVAAGGVIKAMEQALNLGSAGATIPAQPATTSPQIP